MTIDEILAKPVAGNAHSDYDLWQMLYRFAGSRDETIRDRAKAIRHMFVLTGVDESQRKTDTTLVASYEHDALSLAMPSSGEAYRIHFSNLGYYHPIEYSTLVEAMRAAKECGFDSTIVTKVSLMAYSIIGGFRIL